MAISVAPALAALMTCILAAEARLPQPPPGYKQPLKPSETREMQHRLLATTTRRPLTTTAVTMTDNDESPFTVHHVDEVLNISRALWLPASSFTCVLVLYIVPMEFIAAIIIFISNIIHSLIST